MNKFRSDLEITKDMLQASSGLVDIYTNKFDITWFNNLTEEQKKVKHFSILPEGIENAEDDGLVSYKYNSDFFRCDEFTNIHNSKYHVVFGGCSETEGVGGNLNETWAYKLYLELKNKYDLDGYYSLGKSGNGWSKIALSLINYSEKYGTPTHFFVMLPNIGRNYYWDKENNKWDYLQKYVNEGWEIGPHKKENLFDADEHKRQFIEFTIGWKIFNSYCKSNNIKILYSTWDYRENNNLNVYDHQSNIFIESNANDGLIKFIESKYPDMNVPKNLLRKRDNHQGDIVHEYWKNIFIKEIEKRGLFDD